MQQTVVGDVRFRDADGNGYINDNDRTLVGKPDPDFTFGMTNTFKYKNFDLSILITGQTGGKVYGLLGRAMDRPGMGVSINVLSRWKICGDRKKSQETAKHLELVIQIQVNYMIHAGCTVQILLK